MHREGPRKHSVNTPGPQSIFQQKSLLDHKNQLRVKLTHWGSSLSAGCKISCYSASEKGVECKLIRKFPGQDLDVDGLGTIAPTRNA